MADGTKIEWTDASWNPLRARVGDRLGWHCEILTPGCEHCYAEALNHRVGTGDDYLKKARRAEVFLDEKMLAAPLRWRRPRRVFVCSMSDLFGEWVSDEMIERVFGVMERCPQHTFQVLSKRAERMRSYLRKYTPMKASGVFPGRPGPLPNVWLGVSVEDQRRADERIPSLLDTPAAVRWISAEPLLEPLTLGSWQPEGCYIDWRRGFDGCEPPIPRLDWVVCGGESGPGARPCDINWLRAIVAQCREAGVPCFVKQLGAHPYGSGFLALKSRKGGNPDEWPEDLRVRDYPRGTRNDTA